MNEEEAVRVSLMWHEFQGRSVGAVVKGRQEVLLPSRCPEFCRREEEQRPGEDLFGEE